MSASAATSASAGAAPLAKLDFPVYDADNHFYEPEDAIIGHMPAKYRKEFQFVDVEGRRKLAINGKISAYIPNPTFEVVAAPGVHLKYYRGQNHDGQSMREMTGKVIRPSDAMRGSVEERLKVMDEQGIHATLMFPTLFSAIENRMSYDHDLLFAALHSLNRWTEEHWGYARAGRLFATPIISLADIDKAVAELEWALSKGARSVCLRPAPVPGYRGTRSPGFEEFDPFWARVNEAKIFVALHGSDSGYDHFINLWTGGQEWHPFEPNPFKECLRIIDRAISDTVSALICHGVFDRHPDVRVACIENGAFWVEPLLKILDHVYGQMPQHFRQHPVATFKKHIYVAPFAEDSIGNLKEAMDPSRILFGSDWPHPEGYHTPLDFVAETGALSAADRKKVMSSNLKGLLEGTRD
jgi:predicted TIM-barrel fold metal-dependent hydrolase